MTRAARKAAAAADALLAWMHSQPGPLEATVENEADKAPDPAPSGERPDDDAPAGDAAASGGEADPPIAPALPTPSAGGKADARNSHGVGTMDGGDAEPHAPLCLPHTDWLHHRLAVTGPAEAVEGFRDAAAGAGIIPWQLDFERMQEDFLHLLVKPPPPHARTLSVLGARVLAGQLRDAVERRHGLAVARVGRSQACPFDLHALLPVPENVLRLGPDGPAALAWLWENWGTTALRRVALDRGAAEDPRRQPPPGEAAWHLTFWSADWTPWRALARLAETWPSLRFAVRPTYEP